LAISTSVVFQDPFAGSYFGSGRFGTSFTARMAVIFNWLFSSLNDNGAGSGKRARSSRASARRPGARPASPAATLVVKKVRRFMADSPCKRLRTLVARTSMTNCTNCSRVRRAIRAGADLSTSEVREQTGNSRVCSATSHSVRRPCVIVAQGARRPAPPLSLHH
jgi:hypothetical protein